MVYHDNRRQTQKNHTFRESLNHACSGLMSTLGREKNFRRDSFIAVGVVILAAYLGVNLNQWLWLIAAIFLVLLAELWNTVIENVVDLLVEKHYHPLAKIIKDVSAGAVLLTAVFAVIIGLLVLGPEIKNMVVHIWF